MIFDNTYGFNKEWAATVSEQEFVDEFADRDDYFPAKPKNPRYGPKTEEELAEDKANKIARLKEVYQSLVPASKRATAEAAPATEQPGTLKKGKKGEVQETISGPEDPA